MIELSGVEAWRNVEEANALSRWKSVVARAQSPALLAEPEDRVGIGIEDEVFCIGSCFAKNIEIQLVKAGMRVLSHPDFAPADGSPFEPLPHVFNIRSIVNEFRWGLTDEGPLPEASFIAVGEGGVFDPTSTEGLFGTDHGVIAARRAGVTANMKRLKQCRVVIMTLGLVEVWFDRATGLYINSTPPRFLVEREPDRFVFRVLDHGDITAGLEEARDLLVRHGASGLQLFVSVSPVPISATFTDHDVLIANTYSKSTQVAAVRDFCRRHADVHYVPAYESVMNSTRRFTWTGDLRHVTGAVVGDITRRFLETQSVPLPAPAAKHPPMASDWPIARSEIEAVADVPSFFGAVPGDADFPCGFPKVTTSSDMAPQFDGTCLMSPSKRIWHAQRPAQYPEWVLCRFHDPLPARRLFLQAQDGHVDRAPGRIELEAMVDGTWTRILSVRDIVWRFGGEWQGWPIETPVAAAAYRLTILSNSGDPTLLTLQNLYLSPR